MPRSRRSSPLVALFAVFGACLAAAGSPARAASTDLLFGLERLEGEMLSDESRTFDQLVVQAEFGGAGSRLQIRVPYVRLDRTGNVVQTADGPIIVGAGADAPLPWQSSTAGEGESG